MNENDEQDSVNTNDSMNDSEYMNVNMNKDLLNILNKKKIVNEEKTDWKPPAKYGLENSEYIIPIYYKTMYSDILDVNYYNIIKDDIRNCRPLNKYQIDYLLTIDNESKNEMILLLNECIKNLITIIQ